MPPEQPAGSPVRPVPAALAAFLRGVERRGAVLAELQCGDPESGDAALALAMRQFRRDAAPLSMGEWPRRFWGLLLAQPVLRRHRGVAIALDATDCLAELGSGPRAALLLRLAAGLDETEGAAVLGIAEPSYRLALQRALPHHPDGRADPQAWQRLGEQVHRRIKTLPPPRLVRLTRAREAALLGAPEPAASPPSLDRARPRWLLPLLWTLLALCAAAFAASFWWRTEVLLDGPGRGQVWQRELPAEAPASRYGVEAGLVAHRDFELLADPQALAAAEQLGFHSWLAAQSIGAPAPGAEAGPDHRDDAASAAAPSAPAVLQDFQAVLPLLQPHQRAELQQHAARWSGWSESERFEFAARAAAWDALPPDERGHRRERFRAWQALPAAERGKVQAAARQFATLPPERRQALRVQFDALDRSERRGWLLGPSLGADYPALQPLLAQVPVAEHAGLLRVLRAMDPRQRRDLAVLVQRTPPQQRARLRRELVSTAAANRDDWLWERLHR